MADEKILEEIRAFRARREERKRSQEGGNYEALPVQKAREGPLARLLLYTSVRKMDRRIAIVAAAGFLAGILAGFLSWGVPAQRFEAELARARSHAEMLEKQRDEIQAQTLALDAELKRLQARLAAVAKGLRPGRERPANEPPARPEAIPGWR